MRLCVLALATLLSLVPTLGATFQVRHDHDPWGACTGTVTIDESGISFASDKAEHSHNWNWQDIQTVDWKSRTAFTVISYRDQKLLLGRDQPYDFTLTPGSEEISDQVLLLVRGNLRKPIVNRLPVESAEVEYMVPVKHLHTFGGCEGRLLFSRDKIVYLTGHEKDARSWERDRDIAAVWSANRFDLEIEAFEKQGGDLQRSRLFRFQLKEPLDPNYYNELRRAFLVRR